MKIWGCLRGLFPIWRSKATNFTYGGWTSRFPAAQFWENQGILWVLNQIVPRKNPRAVRVKHTVLGLFKFDPYHALNIIIQSIYTYFMFILWRVGIIWGKALLMILNVSPGRFQTMVLDGTGPPISPIEAWVNHSQPWFGRFYTYTPIYRKHNRYSHPQVEYAMFKHIITCFSGLSLTSPYSFICYLLQDDYIYICKFLVSGLEHVLFFHNIWDVIRNPLTFTPSFFKMQNLHHQPEWKIVCSLSGKHSKNYGKSPFLSWENPLNHNF